MFTVLNWSKCYAEQEIAKNTVLILCLQVRQCVTAVPSSRAIRSLTSETCRVVLHSGRLSMRVTWMAVRCWALRILQSRSTLNIFCRNSASPLPPVLPAGRASQTETSGSGWHAWRTRPHRSLAASPRVLTCTDGQMEVSHSLGEMWLFWCLFKAEIYLRYTVIQMSTSVQQKLVCWWTILWRRSLRGDVSPAYSSRRAWRAVSLPVEWW